MCTTNIVTYQYPDGQKKTVKKPTFCSASRHGRVCSENCFFKHPTQYVGAASPPSGSPYLGAGYQPTPPYTPQAGTPISYRSGDESDRSRGSGSSHSSRKRHSGIQVTYNGQAIDFGHSRSRSGERIVLVENPPTPRTPPQAFNAPLTAPSSPSAPYVLSASPPRRPIIVDERHRPRVEIVEPPRKHVRHPSNSSHDSRHSRHSDEEEARERRRQRRLEERLREEEEIREQKKRSRIARANAEISRRSAVPMAPTPPPPQRSSAFARPVVEVPDRDAEIADQLRRLRIEQESRRAEREEEEALEARLRERLQPKRRATVGPGSRRPTVRYGDKVYRYE